MGILDRFAEIMSANINAGLDKLEDPSKMVYQHLRTAKENLADVKKDTAAVLAEERRCKELYEQAMQLVQKYDAIARAAVNAGNDADALQALEKKAQLEEEAASRQKLYEAAKVSADKMRAMYSKLNNDVSNLQNSRARIKATASVAKAQETVNKLGASYTNKISSKFEQLEEKVNSRLYAAEASAELDKDPDDDLFSKYAGGGSSAASDALAKLKAEMNK